ncbi:MAG: hypothetical protein HRU29_00605 [Rhizobiales bacterium]|nr:hypothetical protein [Hyphomicrobiales bacterium]NRB12874.1 hypothetical protein [Hyphomicrobiales bacterium]
MKHNLTVFFTVIMLALSPQLTYAENHIEEDEIQEFGLVTVIEDGAYPMFNLTIEFPERGFSEPFNLNIEDMPFDSQYLSQADGKYVSFFYTSTLDNSLFEIELAGSFLLGDGTIYQEWQRLEGVLQDANSATMTDLPDMVNIVDAAGISHNFAVFITPEMVQANGQMVTAYFAVFTNNNITKLEIVGN